MDQISPNPRPRRVGPVEPDLLASAVFLYAEYLRGLESTRLSLVLHGHSPLTFRLFESLSRRCLTLAQDLGCIRFASCGLTAGQHYVAVRQDLSDLAERVRFYLDHPLQAQKIADAGFAHFKRHFMFSGVNLPQPLYSEITATWNGVDLPPGRATLSGLAVRLLLPLIHSL